MFNREPFSLLSPPPSPRVRARRRSKPYRGASRPVDVVDVDVDDDALRRARGPLLDALPTPVRPAHFDTTVITAGTLAGSTVGYSVGVRRLWLGLVFFGRVSRCPLVAFFLACLAARTVNVIGAPIVARAMMRGRPRARACVCGRAAGSTAGTRGGPVMRACARPRVDARSRSHRARTLGTSRYEWASSIKTQYDWMTSHNSS